MTVNSQRLLLAAAGAGGAAAAGLYVDDVFSCFLYEGNGSSQTITNGIDLSGEGGLVWVKGRTSQFHNQVVMDTERGATSSLITNSQASAETTSARISGFTSTGFTVGSNENVNGSGHDYVSWTFRKAPGFFDVVTYTGNGTAGRTVSHSLGSVPGLIMVKRIDTNDDWAVWHRSLGATKYLQLNLNDAEADLNTIWNDTEPTSTNFTVGVNGKTNTNGSTYVAYIFAHDDQSFGTDEDEAIIKCGSFTTNSSSEATVNLGFEPQWFLIKSADYNDSWYLFDTMRGFTVGTDHFLQPNTADADSSSSISFGYPTATGWSNVGDTSQFFASSDYVYIAIRRPHKPPEAASDVFKPFSLSAGEGSDTFISTGFPVDTFIYRKKTTGSTVIGDRLRGIAGGGDLLTNSNDAEASNSGAFFLDHSDGVTVDFSGGHYAAAPAETSSSYVRYFFRRAPGFFDVVAYNGSASNQAISHNLEAVPEFMILKKRDEASDWTCYHSAIGNTKSIMLHEANAQTHGRWNSTSPTATNFTVVGDLSHVNESGKTYIAYLFASLSGVSKVGSYTGTGSNIGVDCGFTAGARFVMIKRTDSSGDWYYWDSARGIVGGNDSYLRFNVTTAEQDHSDFIDPLNSGFTVTSTANAELNASGGTYLFLAIA